MVISQDKDPYEAIRMTQFPFQPRVLIDGNVEAFSTSTQSCSASGTTCLVDPATQNCRLPTLQKPHWFELIWVDLCVFFFMCFFNHKVFSTTFGRVLNDEIRGSFPPFLGGIGVGLVECMLWTPFNLGILLAPQPWDGWIYLQPESLLVTSYHQVFLQFFLPFSDSSQEGGFFLLKIVSLKNKCWFFSPDVCQKSRWGWLQKRVKRLPVGMWWHSWQVFFGGEGAKVKFSFWHSVLVSFQPGLRVFDLIRSLMFFLPIDL